MMNTLKIDLWCFERLHVQEVVCLHEPEVAQPFKVSAGSYRCLDVTVK
jgi:hypothetical protein